MLSSSSASYMGVWVGGKTWLCGEDPAVPGGALEDGTSPLQAGLLRLVLEHGSSCRVASGTPQWGWWRPQSHSLQEAQARRPWTSAGSRIRMSYWLPEWGSLCVFVCISKTLYFFLGNFFLTGLDGLF